MIIVLGVVIWLILGILSMIPAAIMNRTDNTLVEEIEEMADMEGASLGMFLMMIFGPLCLILISLVAVIVMMEMSVKDIILYIPKQVAKFIDWLFINPKDDNEHQ